MKRRYYDKDGNEIRSNPSKPFFKKWWLVLIIILGIGTVYIIGRDRIVSDSTGSNVSVAENKSTTLDNEVIEEIEKTSEQEINDAEVPKENHMADADEIIEDTKTEQFYTFEDFKGTYVAFEGEPFESRIKKVFSLENDSFWEEAPESSGITKEIINKIIDGKTLILDWQETRQGANGNLSVISDNQRNIHIIHENNSVGELFYSMSSDSLVNNYDIYEIDYARIMLMTGVPRLDPEEPVIYVREIPAGTSIFNLEGSPSYPETVISLTSRSNNFSNHDIYSTVYSAQGDGYITIYPQPSNFEIDIEAESSEDYYKLAQEILDNAETVYVDPSLPYLVADFIATVEFVYE